MTSIIRRNRNQQVQPRTWDPFETMKAMMAWDPFRSDSMWPDLFDNPAMREVAVFSPKFDVKETRKGYVFKADLPGVKEEDLHVTLTGNRLTVEGKREMEERKEGETWHTFERAMGSFSRSFTLPEGTDADKITADLKNGVLTITVPRSKEAETKKISVRSVIDKVKGALDRGGKDDKQS